MLILKIAGIVLGALVLLAFGLSAYLFVFACRKNGKGDEFDNLERLKKGPLSPFAEPIEKGIKSFHAADKEDVYIKSRDGLRLHGYLIPTENARGTFILVHGWRSRPAYDFSVIWEKYRDMGYNILAIEQRTIGQSEGKYICFGVKERYDLIDWARHVGKRFGKQSPIIFSGISMGSATVMFAVGNDELPENVIGAIADCGFTSAWDQFCYLLRTQYHLPQFPFLYIAELYARIFAAFPFGNVTVQKR